MHQGGVDLPLSRGCSWFAGVTLVGSRPGSTRFAARGCAPGACWWGYSCGWANSPGVPGVPGHSPAASAPTDANAFPAQTANPGQTGPTGSGRAATVVAGWKGRRQSPLRFCVVLLSRGRSRRCRGVDRQRRHRRSGWDRCARRGRRHGLSWKRGRLRLPRFTRQSANDRRSHQGFPLFCCDAFE